MGFSFYSHPLTVVMMFVIALVLLLSTPEWKLIHKKLIEFTRKHLHFSLQTVTILFATIILGFSLISLFSILSVGWFANRWLSLIMRLSLPILGFVMVASLYYVSKRKKQLLLQGSILSAGLVIGNAPQWASWLFLGIKPWLNMQTATTLSLTDRFNLVVQQVFSALWGIPPFAPIPFHHIQQTDLWHLPLQKFIPWVIVVSVIFAAIGTFFWKGRKTIWSLVSLAPLSHSERKTAIIALLFLLPMLLVISGGNTSNVWAVRYLFFSLHAGAIILALFFANLLSQKKRIAYTLIALWAVMVFTGNIIPIGKYWSDQTTRIYDPGVITEIEEYLTENDIKGGYTDWICAWSLNYLMEDRLVFDTYNRHNIHKRYTQAVDPLPQKAYIFAPFTHMYKKADYEEMREHLKGGANRDPVNRYVLQRLDENLLLKRKTIGEWDIWLFKDYNLSQEKKRK